mmetsp:Transcript_66706/g.117982  ORF Transcript_66706/g.117982 Transcript_66706/m.117982 type:complete len:175 (-) Transcript_66706:240-764(-)
MLDPKSTVWLGNLAPDTTYQHLNPVMSRAGKCKWIEVNQNGTGFANFSTEHEAQTAIRTLSGSWVKGRSIRVDSYTGKKPPQRRDGPYSTGARKQPNFQEHGMRRAPAWQQYATNGFASSCEDPCCGEDHGSMAHGAGYGWNSWNSCDDDCGYDHGSGYGGYGHGQGHGGQGHW